jgi:hypothetical protein
MTQFPIISQLNLRLYRILQNNPNQAKAGDHHDAGAKGAGFTA